MPLLPRWNDRGVVSRCGALSPLRGGFARQRRRRIQYRPPGSNERSNIDKDEEEALKKLAAHLLSLTTQAIGKALRAGELMEVDCDAQDEITNP